MKKEKSYSVHFIILIFGQVVSIIGNSVIGFALSLYLLNETGSATIFGLITALTAIPWAICGPIGGVLADKFSKKNIMVILDFSTAFMIFALALVGFQFGVVMTVGVVKFLLAIIQATYTPSVTASLVYLVKPDFLIKANSIVSQVNSLARILGPILAGFLYSFMSLENVLIISAIIFFVCASIECFMKIPKISLNTQHNDGENFSFKDSVKFLIKENKYLFYFLCLASLASFCVNPIVSIGLPYIVNIYMDLPSHFFGICSGLASIGSLVAGFLIFLFPKKFTFANCGYVYTALSVVLGALGVCLYIFSGMNAFVILCVSVIFLILSTTLIHILMYSFIQRISPSKMLGKIISCVIIFSGLADPSGQIVYGALFDSQTLNPAIILFFSGVFILSLSIFAIKFCKKAELHAN